jgi:hypothetical protein
MTSPRKLAGPLAGAIAVALVALVALTAGPARAAAPPLAVAIVVGSNHSPSSSFEDLRYGDDDAVQNARTLAMLGAETTLLVAPDAETRELFPKTQPQGPATRAALRAAFDGAKAKLAAAHAAGRATELYFLFAGHGDLADGRPFLQLDDARLWREDLAELLRTAGADENHVIVDACYAASFVSDRGPGGERESLPAGFSRVTAGWPARTGFLTARSASGQTHEWAEYQSGVFSHELRSGLVGAADVNLDGKVTYREIAAFVRRANEAIPNRRYRPEVSTSPPGGDLDATLATLPEGPIVLEMDAEPAGRAFVESEAGIRLVDMHAAAGTHLLVRLPVDLGSLFVEQESTPNVPSSMREFRVEAKPGRVRMSTLAMAEPHVTARGAGHEAFMHLFADPFDAGAVSAFNLDASDAATLKWQHDADVAAHARTVRRKVALSLWGASVATAAVGAGFVLSGRSLYDADHPISGASSLKAADDKPTVDQRYRVGETLLGVAGAAAVSGAVLWFWPSAPQVSVASTPGCEACLAYQRSF